MTRSERPDEDADASEIARWMEADFWAAVTEGVENPSDEEPDK